MRGRCYNQRNHKFPRYGGRGISVCRRWDKFENFLADMGRCPKGKSLDRIDNNGNYEPGNCRWATRKQQARNTATNRLIEFDGKSYCAAEWSEKTGLSEHMIYQRIRLGWTAKRALTTPRLHG